MSGEGHVIHLLNANSFKSALQSGYVFSSNSISSDAYTFAEIYIYIVSSSLMAHDDDQHADDDDNAGVSGCLCSNRVKCVSDS